MGTYRTTFVGVYLEIPFVKHETKVITYKHPVTGHKMPKRFCADTGIEGIAKERIDTNYFEPNLNIQDEEGFREDMFFTPAYTGGGKRISTSIYDGDDKVFGTTIEELENYNFGEDNSENIIRVFKEKYKKYLDYVDSLYDDIQICYGVVNYAH